MHDIKTGVKEIENIDWIHLAYDTERWYVFCKHDNEPSGSRNGRKIP
jgi:hypothetical protein